MRYASLPSRQARGRVRLDTRRLRWQSDDTPFMLSHEIYEEIPGQ